MNVICREAKMEISQLSQIKQENSLEAMDLDDVFVAQTTISSSLTPLALALSHSSRNVLNASLTYLAASTTVMFSTNLSG